LPDAHRGDGKRFFVRAPLVLNKSAAAPVAVIAIGADVSGVDTVLGESE
jgi:hypothetical protein